MKVNYVRDNRGWWAHVHRGKGAPEVHGPWTTNALMRAWVSLNIKPGVEDVDSTEDSDAQTHRADSRIRRNVQRDDTVE